jgi:DNA mismatch endonuclease, patch repair protein
VGKKAKAKTEVSKNMSAIRSTDNKTERALRSILHRRGLRFRKDVKALPGRPDIVFSRARLAVFVDGDYWHGRMLREHGPEYVSQYFQPHQRPYWTEKLERNVKRDDAVTNKLESEGWVVLRLWESDIKRNLSMAADRIEEIFRRGL